MKPNRHSLGPCPVCGCARLIDTGEGACTRHSPRYHQRLQKTQYARRLAAGKFRSVARGTGNHFTDPDRTPIKRCNTCSDVPWRRDAKGCRECKRPFADEAPIARREVIGSMLGRM